MNIRNWLIGGLALTSTVSITYNARQSDRNEAMVAANADLSQKLAISESNLLSARFQNSYVTIFNFNKSYSHMLSNAANQACLNFGLEEDQTATTEWQRIEKALALALQNPKSPASRELIRSYEQLRMCSVGNYSPEYFEGAMRDAKALYKDSFVMEDLNIGRIIYGKALLSIRAIEEKFPQLKQKSGGMGNMIIMAKAPRQNTL
jgi:hypothetical protein